MTQLTTTFMSEEEYRSAKGISTEQNPWGLDFWIFKNLKGEIGVVHVYDDHCFEEQTVGFYSVDHAKEYISSQS